MAANGDEFLQNKIGNFHKTLPHDAETGLVEPSAYVHFARIAESRELDFDEVARGPCSEPFHPGFARARNEAARLVNPLASRSREHCGPDPAEMDMLPAPGVQSCSTAAEMVELYWMALLRDVEFCKWSSGKPSSDLTLALTQVREAYDAALVSDASLGRLRLGLDLPAREGKLDLRLQTLFRSGLPDEDKGPLVSQFFLHNPSFGTQTIDQRQRPYRKAQDFLWSWQDWLTAQNCGRDFSGADYGDANTYDDAFFLEKEPRFICTMRDLARFVHKDALHQAYFNAALLLLGWGAPPDPNTPYFRMLPRQTAFATLGPPHLLTLVSEVASRALKVVWRQKWAVHRRLRPEAYGGVLEAQRRTGRDLGLADCLKRCGLPYSDLLKRVAQHNKAQSRPKLQGEASWLLPMAFSSGSPVHPAYGAGHATVAGACVTVLKAWFDEDRLIGDIAPKVLAGCCEGAALYKGDDVNQMTVGGELNKLASNVAMGRSMGGVHWRSDNTRSLRLGEQIATVMLRRQCRDYAEPGYALSYRNFDGRLVSIDAGGRVQVDGDPGLQAFYMQDRFAPRS
ncbi:vanadium-dependent haloperoxidase [Aquimonas voraii]|uniref:PAP2 superfamily protein n=1 Tax=Aquimonas voraii TaxID=265719 RepID=A0A1G6S057_9GAMM|nr:vanadium-dependent haloperoxidase [Aquimonas voraii]SDD10063.1 hypothetical protein SAMN04488509_101206 [Aquimonas voraii]